MIGKDDSVLEGGDDLAVVPSVSFVAAASYRPTMNEAVESYLLQLPSKESRQTYAKNLRYFAEYVGAKSAADALARLVNGGRVAARLLLDKYVEAMREQGRKANTINARLAALRCAMACLYDMELISWTIKYKGVKTRGYRDMKGPSLPVFRSLLAVASCQRGIRSLRDPALLRLLFCLGLRRGEVSSLDIGPLQPQRASPRCRRQGSRQRAHAGYGATPNGGSPRSVPTRPRKPRGRAADREP
jgi:integrase